MNTVITGAAIGVYQLIVWRGALKLEALGMKRRGRPVAAIVREHYGLGKRAPIPALIERLTADIEAAK